MNKIYLLELVSRINEKDRDAGRLRVSSCDFDLIQTLARQHIEELRTSRQSWAALGYQDSLGQSGRQVTGSVREAAP